MTESIHQIHCKITYISVERKTGWYDQTYNSTNHHVILYTHSISTAKNTFQLKDVLDLSYRPFSGGAGLFYLHTNQGVFTYNIDEDPSDFILTYKKLKSDSSQF